MKLSTQNVLLSFITLVTVAFSGTPASASLGGAELMSRSLAAIERHYVEPRRILPRKMLEASLKRIAEVIPEFFFVMQPDAVSITLGHASRRFALSASPSVSDIRRSFREIFPFIDTHYHGPLPHEDIEFTAIDGMVEVLDPHSSFLPPKIYSEFKVGTKGEFGGLGIVIGIRKGTLTVIAALDGTPAARAGIKAEDRIIQIDDLSTINLSLVDAVNKLRGKIGAPVTLQVERSGKTAPLHFALKRALIQIDSVQSTTIDQADKHIGYIKIKSFQENTDRDVAKALASFRTSEKPISGLILDLRNNPGGLLDQSVAISDHFLTSGTVVSTVAARGKVLDEENASADHNEFQLPLIVLVNEGSASASEIVSGALQHHGRAVIVGSRTFGKGSVQTIFELDDQAALKLTIAQYLAGGAKSIQLHGVTPDIELLPVTVDAKEMDIVKDRFIDETLLDEHLERDGRPDENARYHVKFLVPKKEKNPEDDDSAKEYEKNLDFSDDIAVKLAKRLITEAGEPQAEKMLTQAKPIIDSLMKEQDGWLSAALDKIGVDWKITPKSAESPLLRIGFDLKVKGEKRHFLHAGDEATIEFTAKNIGKGAFSQLLGVIQTDAGFLADKELVFGELLPKASKIAVATIKAPEGITSQDIPITVSFQEFHGRAPASLEAIIPVVGDPAPEFAFDLRLKNPSDLTKLRSGKSIELMVDIENTGQGSTSDEAVALLQSKTSDHIFLQKGRFTLGVLKPGEKKSTTFAFRVDAPIKEPALNLEFLIADAKRSASLIKQINLPSDGNVPFAKEKKRFQPPQITFSAEPPRSTNADKISLTGTIRDDGTLMNYLVFVSNKKIAYFPTPTSPSETPFTLSVPLEPGSNIITIAAQDNDEMLAKKVAIIYRASGTPKHKFAREQH